MPALDLIIGPNFIFALAKRRNIVYNIFRTRRCDGIGRRSGLKIRRWRQRGGPSPPTGTKTKDRFGAGRSTLRYYDARAGKAHPAQFSASLRIYGAKALRPRRAVSKLGACTSLNDLAQSEQIVVSCSDWARSFFSYLTDKTGNTRNCIQRRNAAMFQNLFAAVFLRRASQNQGSKFI